MLKAGPTVVICRAVATLGSATNARARTVRNVTPSLFIRVLPRACWACTPSSARVSGRPGQVSRSAGVVRALLGKHGRDSQRALGVRPDYVPPQADAEVIGDPI